MNCCDNIRGVTDVSTEYDNVLITCKCQLPLPLPWLQCTVYCLLPTGQNFLFFLQESTTTLFMWLLCRVGCSAVLQLLTVQFTVKNRFFAVQLQKQLWKMKKVGKGQLEKKELSKAGESSWESLVTWSLTLTSMWLSWESHDTDFNYLLWNDSAINIQIKLYIYWSLDITEDHNHHKNLPIYVVFG